MGVLDINKYNELKGTKKYIVCDCCKKRIKLENIKIRNTRVIIDNVTLYVEYFRCTKCMKAYIIMIKDEDLKNLLEKANKYVEAIKLQNEQNVKDKQARENLLKEYITLRCKIIDIETKLKLKYKDKVEKVIE